MTHVVIYGQGEQTLYHVPIDRLGRETRVSSATYTIVDLTEGTTSSNREVVASTAATVDAASTTLSAVAGRTQSNPRAMTVAAVNGFTVGRRFLISSTGDDGHREMFTLERAQSSGLILHARQDLQGEYAASDPVRGLEISAPFPAAVADDEDLAIKDRRDYQIVWSYTIDGHDWLVGERIRVERYSVAPWVTSEYVLLGRGYLKSRVSRELLQESLVVSTQEVSGSLSSAGVPQEYYRPDDDDKLAVRAMCLSLLYEACGGEDAREQSTFWREEYRSRIALLLEGRQRNARVVNRQDDTSAAKTDDTDIFVPT